MLRPYLPQLNQLKIALASGSKQRKDILEQAGVTFSITANFFSEDLNWQDYLSAKDYVRATAEGKIRMNVQPEFDITICADTIVECNEIVYEKPSDAQEAKEFYLSFSGQKGYVHTAVFVSYEGRICSDVFTSELVFDELDEAMIDAYVETGEWQGVSGGLMIENQGGTIIKEIHGCFFNIVGLPLNGICRLLIQALKTEEPKNES